MTSSHSNPTDRRWEPIGLWQLQLVPPMYLPQPSHFEDHPRFRLWEIILPVRASGNAMLYNLLPSDRIKQRIRPCTAPSAARRHAFHANHGVRKEYNTFHQTNSDSKPLKIPIVISHPPSMQARQTKLTRKRSIQIRVTCSIAFLLAIAAIVQYALLSSANNQKHPRLSQGKSQAIPKSEVQLSPTPAKPLQSPIGKDDLSGHRVPVSKADGILNANGGLPERSRLPGGDNGLLSPAQTNPIR